jgi:hypothetical protein
LKCVAITDDQAAVIAPKTTADKVAVVPTTETPYTAA